MAHHPMAEVMLRKANVNVYDVFAHGMPLGYLESGFGDIEELNFLGEEVLKMIKNGMIPKKAREFLNLLNSI
jgi:hypothetical protein